MSSDQLTIVMYHYVRDLAQTRYPSIKGLDTKLFEAQLDYLDHYYQFVTMEQCIAHIYEGARLPARAVLLTFDDGYTDHYTDVFPILDRRGIQGSFFPPAKTIQDHVVLDVNKIHFLLASVNDPRELVGDVFRELDQIRLEGSDSDLESNSDYFDRLAVSNRFDSPETIFVKRMLQRELPAGVRNQITDKLFRRYVTEDEEAFARELYLSTEQILSMQRHGMFFGGHGFEHVWLSHLSRESKEREIEQTLEFLGSIGALERGFVMCYPYGAYDQEVVELLKEKNCRIGLTTEVAVAKPSLSSALTLPRLDTNDLPKNSKTPANQWTQQVLD